MPLSLICDCDGPMLTEAEKAFFNEVQPYGFILFQRHCESPDQVRALVADLQACVAHDAPIFVDQEGGRVARLKPPHWETFPPAGVFAELLYKDEAVALRACYLNARLLAATLLDVGVNADCAPVADLRIKGAHDIIGDRAFGETPEAVIALARAQAQGLMDGGVYPVLKHIPGHGRALADSHLDLPVVDTPLHELEQSDFAPFKALGDLPFAMTAHIRFTALDAAQPITLSVQGIRYIREELGYQGLLMSDDITMKALQGDLDDIAFNVLRAGCDLVLLCNASLEERQKVAQCCVALSSEQLARVPALSAQQDMEIQECRSERDALLHQNEHAIAAATMENAS